MGDATRLRRAVAMFQRNLGKIFGNAGVRRRNRRYEIEVAVYETPIARTGAGRAYRMPERQIRAWIKTAADRVHPRLYRRVRVDVKPWKMGWVSKRVFCPVMINVDAGSGNQTDREQ